jgi:formate hydrogenlyase subunit 4
VFLTLGFVAKSWDINGILLSFSQAHWFGTSPFIYFTLIAFGFVLLAECARYPVDNPATHLELTMVHEAMILEYSGPYLAMLELASAIKILIFSIFFLNVLFPIFAFATNVSSVVLLMGLTIVKLFVAGSSIALVETVLVKMRFYRMQEYMTIAYFLGVAGLILTLAF